MATNDPNSDTGAPTVRHDGYDLTAQFATTESGTTVCTIYPAHVEDDDRTASWVSAEEGSFVTASNYR